MSLPTDREYYVPQRDRGRWKAPEVPPALEVPQPIREPVRVEVHNHYHGGAPPGQVEEVRDSRVARRPWYMSGAGFGWLTFFVLVAAAVAYGFYWAITEGGLLK